MTRSSRYLRPERPSARLVLQPRDYQLLETVAAHRYIRSDHMRELLFPAASITMTRRRLRQLWEHRLLDRYYLPFVLDAEHPVPPKATQPIYALGSAGARLLVERSAQPSRAPARSVPRASSGFVALEHHLVVTDLLVAIETACRGRADVGYEESAHDFALAAELTEAEQDGRHRGPAIVPDAAFTLSYPATSERLTFYVEVVRASVKRGNHTLEQKFQRYVELHRQGFFRQVYGHERIRAVIIATTSNERAENFRALAERLPHGRNFFWFGSYQQKDDEGRERSTLTTETVLASRWRTVAGEVMSIVPQGAAPATREAAPLED